MNKLEKVVIALRRNETSETECSEGRPGAVSLLLSTLLYLVALLAFPAVNIRGILWMALWPAVAAPLLGMDYAKLILKSTVALPFVLLVGAFNPIMDRNVAFSIDGWMVTYGWLSFIGLAVRGMLAVQGVLVLVGGVGVRGICKGAERLRVPRFLTSQTLMAYRYIRLMGEEALAMVRARQSRGFGKRALPVKMWGEFMGQLYFRSLARGERIHRSMVARGFNGTLPSLRSGQSSKWHTRDWLWLLLTLVFCITVFVLN